MKNILLNLRITKTEKALNNLKKAKTNEEIANAIDKSLKSHQTFLVHWLEYQPDSFFLNQKVKYIKYFKQRLGQLKRHSKVKK
ncbi:hypothetical protein [Arcobacter sp. F2176]|uniref:hypothetical protein n=1 Tax=Arcobacter sp. F2176 TaxID=2044511 RepID=UPI00100B1143|nr:hypothetical protein [Arcobacter sp. F2176]RXJ82159.1 hypothetical protein CRU95_04540 [Arcobacter sp. F2176]